MFQIKGVKEISGITGVLFYDNPDKPIFAAAWRGDQVSDSTDWRIKRTYPNGFSGSTGFSLEDIRGCTYVVPIIFINRGLSSKPFVQSKGYEKVLSNCTSSTCDVLNCFDLSEAIDGIGKYQEDWIGYWDGIQSSTSNYNNQIISYDIEPGFTSDIFVLRGITNMLGSSNRWEFSKSGAVFSTWENQNLRATGGYTAPDSTMTATRIEWIAGNPSTPGFGNGYGNFRQRVPIVSGQTYTFSYWIKSAGTRENPSQGLCFSHRFFNNTDPGINIDINRPNEFASASEWRRTSATFYTGTAGVFHIFPYIASRNGVSGDAFFIWRAQFEKGDTATNYVENKTGRMPNYYPSTAERISTIEGILGISLTGRIVIDPFRYHYRDSLYNNPKDSILSDGSPVDWSIHQSAFRGCCANLRGLTAWPSLWPDEGIERVKAEWSTWLDEFAASGRKIDYIGFDNEADNPADSYNIKRLAGVTLGLGGLFAGVEFLKGLTSSSKWYSPWRGLPSFSQLVSGFTFTNILEQERCATCDFEYVKWNNITALYGTHALNQAIWVPLKGKFSNVKGSNYDNILLDPDNPGPDINGHPQVYSKYFGTSSSPVLYGTLEQAATSWFVDKNDGSRLIYKNTTGYSDLGDRLVNNYWGAFQKDHQEIRSCVRARRNGLLHPWIAGVSYGSSDAIEAIDLNASKYPQDTRYYYETIRHAALMRTEMFLYWNPSNGPDTSSILYDNVRKPFTKKLDEVLHEINSLIGFRPVAQTITTEPINFTNNFKWITPNDPTKTVISGARLYDGTYLWRVTTGEELATAFLDTNTGKVYELGDEVGVWIKTT